MANYKDNNADLGNQTIEGTEPPIALDAEIVMPDGSSRPIILATAEPEPQVPSAAELDAQLDALLNGDNNEETIVTETRTVMETVTTEPEQTAQDLDAQLAKLMAEPEPDQTTDLDAQLNALLNEDNAEPTPTTDIDALNAQLDALLNDDNAEETIITETRTVTETVTTEPEQATQDQPITVQASEQSSTAQTAPPTQPDTTAATDEARRMMEQAQRIMEQAQQAQLQAAAQMHAAQLQAQAVQAQQASSNAAAQPVHHTSAADNAAADAARRMMEQAQMMLQQAQAAQMQAQRAAQDAQIQAQVVQATRTANPTPVTVTDPYAAKEVDRLKSELDSMRDLVNKLTFTLAQSPNAAQQGVVQTPPQGYGYSPDRDQYRKLESELDSMRREILEKDLRDREKELDRRQKEAENSVKDIRPEMVQMSESRDVAPVPNQNAGFGGEFIPLANGVFYSIKDKQVYVMTPASNAAAAAPTLEPKRTATVKKKPTAHARPTAKKRPLSRHRPVAPPHRRRPPSGRSGRPTPHR